MQSTFATVHADMASCGACRKSLGIVARLTRQTLCAECGRRQIQARTDALIEYEATISELRDGDVAPGELASKLTHLAETAGISAAEDNRRRAAVVRQILDEAIADGVFTPDEMARFEAILDDFGVQLDHLAASVEPRQAAAWHAAMANGGTLKPLDAAAVDIVLRKGELPFLERSANLLKEVVDREWRGRSHGLSFRVARGVYVRTGASRGHSVVTGSHLEVADRGALIVTNRRLVFRGQRRAIELLPAKLIGVQVYDDGITFHVSNRAKSPMFQLDPGWSEAVAATVNALSTTES